MRVELALQPRTRAAASSVARCLHRLAAALLDGGRRALDRAPSALGLPACEALCMQRL